MNLVFIYNADSGVFNTLTDIAHKLLSPDTYQCNLCNLTHGYFTARDEWIGFLRELDSDIEFLHRDEFAKQYGEHNADLPAIFCKQGDDLKLWLDKQVIDKIDSTEALMQLIQTELKKQQAVSTDLEQVVVPES